MIPQPHPPPTTGRGGRVGRRRLPHLFDTATLPGPDEQAGGAAKTNPGIRGGAGGPIPPPRDRTRTSRGGGDPAAFPFGTHPPRERDGANNPRGGDGRRRVSQVAGGGGAREAPMMGGGPTHGPDGEKIRRIPPPPRAHAGSLFFLADDVDAAVVCVRARARGGWGWGGSVRSRGGTGNGKRIPPPPRRWWMPPAEMKKQNGGKRTQSTPSSEGRGDGKCDPPPPPVQMTNDGPVYIL